MQQKPAGAVGFHGGRAPSPWLYSLAAVANVRSVIETNQMTAVKAEKYQIENK